MNGEGLMEAQPRMRYSVLSQRWLTEKELSQFKDVHGLAIAVRMRFSNEGKSHVSYLAGISIIPQGYQWFRKVGETKWQYLPKSRGREGPPSSEFTGVVYTWLELPPGASIEFEAYDWSKDDEEHAFSAFVRKDTDGSAVEVTSDVFRPLSKGQVHSMRSSVGLGELKLCSLFKVQRADEAAGSFG
jgi:hypothetical protein